MFDSQVLERQNREREYWSRVQEHGKVAFIFRTTASIGGVGTLFSYPICRIYVQGSRAMAIYVGCSILSLVVGYIVSERLWQRGVRLTSGY